MAHMRRWWLPGLCCLALPLAAKEGAKAEVRLVAEATAAVPGSSLELGLTFRMQPHWHIYWRAPGDSGAAPRVELTLPPELEQAGPVRWPRPTRLVLAGDLVNHVYEGEVTLLVPVRVKPDAVPDGKPRKITGKLDWLVCDADACIGEEAAVELSLPVSKTGAPSADAAAFARTRATLPRLPERQVRSEWSGTTLRLGVEGARRLTFFPHTPEDHPPPLGGTQAAGSELSLAYPEAARGARVSGHLVAELAAGELDLWIEIPGPERDAR